MAALPKKSSDLLSPSIPCRPNPKPRNSESSDPVRRSFGGNPFLTGKPTHHRVLHNPTPNPANSLSDFSRRKSAGRENTQREYGDKENQRDELLNLPRLSPTPKNAKNFMSPTISAASKINTSPRKKVLAEKNEGPRSSASLSYIGEMTMEETKTRHVRSTVSFSEAVRIIADDNEELKSHTDLDEKPQVGDSYEVNGVEKTGYEDCVDSSFKSSPQPTVAYTSPMVAEADQMMPPYDPKRNYLSPRPQFLHYKPNPRIEHYFEECKQLNDIFTSESSDTEASKEETLDESEEEGESVQAAEENTVRDDDNAVDIDDDEGDEYIETQGVEGMEDERISKTHGIGKFKFLGWLLVLVVAYFALSGNFTLPSELSTLQDSGLYISPEFKESAKAKIDRFGENLRMWSASSSAYISDLITSILREDEEHGRLQFYNLTELCETDSFSAVFLQDNSEINVEQEPDINNYQEPEEPCMQESGEDNSEVVFEVEDIEAETFEFHQEILTETDTNDQEELKIAESDGIYKYWQGLEVVEGEEEFQPLLEDISREESRDIDCNNEGEEVTEASSEENHNAESRELQEQIETENGIIDAEKPGRIESVPTDIEESAEISEISEGNLSKKQTVIVLSVALAIAVITSAMALSFSKRVTPLKPVSKPTTPLVENLSKERISAKNFQQTEVDDRMSSSFENNGVEEQSEAQNGAKKSSKKASNSSNIDLRRESLASSASEYSIDSASFGSFTTYERIPIKSGLGEEEVITPVRRSSRLRNQHSAH